MLNTPKKTIPLFLLALCLPLPTLAQQPGTVTDADAPFIQMFQQLDADRNGLLTSYEAQRSSKIFFNLTDKNKDGVLTRDEYMENFKHYKGAEQEAELRKYLEKNDINKDGMITQFEDMNANKAIFKKLDISGDGNVTLDEFIAGMR